MYKIFYSWLFYFMLAHFGLLIYLFWANIKHLWQEIKKIDGKIWLLLLVIFLFGFYLRNSEYWLGTHTDGYVAQESAHLWVLYGQHVKACALGNHQDCKLFEQVLAPPGSPFIIALAHLIFGIHSLNASVISAILSSLTIILVFLIAYLIFKKEEIGLYAALVFSLIPLNIINSQTGEARPTGLFFVGLTILFYLLALKNNRFITWLLVAVALSYAIYVRQESYILVPLLLIFFVIFKWQSIKEFIKKIREKIIDAKPLFYAVFLGWIFFILQIPVLRWLLYENPYNTYPGGGIFGLNYKTILIPAKALLLHFFNLSPVANMIFHYNLLASIVFGAAVLFLIFTRKKEPIFILGLLLAYFFIYSLLFDGNIYGTGQITGDYFRRTLMFHLPYAIIAGFGFYYFNPIKNKKFLPLSLLMVALLLIFINPLFTNSSVGNIQRVKYPSFINLPLKNIYKVKFLTKNYELYFPKSLFRDARATKVGDRTLIYPSPDYWTAIARTPNDCLIITSQYMIPTNDYFKNNQRKTADIDFINYGPKNLFLGEFKKNKCLVYFSDYRCNGSYPDSNDFSCSFIKKHLNMTFLFQEGRVKAYQAILK